MLCVKMGYVMGLQVVLLIGVWRREYVLWLVGMWCGFIFTEVCCRFIGSNLAVKNVVIVLVQSAWYC